ncbi:hypothetical protein O181_096911 [Austropuccinia psidii MF-1]|uniref:Uncharacterized protein n=1 Tax=Austropuccinia psidii MF-1 TaxID=1389203 RepID=A0A9Q3PEM0_9BASI|nr:hypothetical protein [Austropuccinia psidii MF-1]
MEEDESKGIKSMSEQFESMCTCYSEKDILFGHKPNVTPIARYNLQEKDSYNGDDDVDVLLNKENNGLESPLNLVPLLHNEDDLVKAENLQDESKSKSIMHSTQKCNQALMPNWNDKSGSRKRLVNMFAPTYANFLESRKNAHEASENAHLEWDRERWNEEKASNMEKQGLKKSSCKSKWSFRRSNIQRNMNLKKKSGIMNWN